MCVPCKMVARKTNSLKSRTLRVLRLCCAIDTKSIHTHTHKQSHGCAQAMGARGRQRAAKGEKAHSKLRTH